MRDLVDVMDKLGEMKAYDIAAHFEEHGIQGVCGSAGHCVVAEYVRQETGMEWVVVDGYMVQVSDAEEIPSSEAYVQSALITHSVGLFISQFDTHAYPHLEK